MLGWILRKFRGAPSQGVGAEQLEWSVDQQIAIARTVLDSFQEKMRNSHPDARRMWEKGLEEMAHFVARRLGIADEAALDLSNVHWERLAATRDDLVILERTESVKLKTATDAASKDRAFAREFGRLVFLHFVNMRFIADQGPESRRNQAKKLADAYSQFAHLMGDHH